MKNRILKGWTIQRAFYLLAGVLLAFQAFMSHQVAGVLIGIYFASMGIFSFGCASGNCSVNYNSKQGSEKTLLSNKND